MAKKSIRNKTNFLWILTTKDSIIKAIKWAIVVAITIPNSWYLGIKIISSTMFMIAANSIGIKDFSGFNFPNK